MKFERSRTVALFGLPITNVTMQEAVERIAANVESGRTHQIATANLDFARNSLKDSELQRVICECSMVLPDGAPMLWASKLFGRPLKERVTGVDLVPQLAKISAERGFGIFLLGSSEKNAKRAAMLLEEMHPGVKIVGRYSPPVKPLDQMDDAAILEQIEAAKPDILLVAFGNPKQELWIHRNRHLLKVPVSIGVGGALDMIAGSLKRAPRWVQVLQMEWVFRMAQEPFRLLPRYLGDAAALLRHLPMGLVMNGLQPGRGEAGDLQVYVNGRARIVAVPETLTDGVCHGLILEAQAAAKDRQMLVIDMSQTTRVEADGLGGLLEARRLILSAGLWIWLAGMSTQVKLLLQCSALSDLFLLAGTPADVIRLASLGQIYERRRGTLLPMPQQLPRMERRAKLSKVSAVG